MPAMPAARPSSFADPGPMTRLEPDQLEAVRSLGLDGVRLIGIVQGLVVDPEDPTGAGLSPRRLAERNERAAGALLRRVTELDPSPLDHARPTEHRIAGTCRHYAVLATAFLRAVGVPARSRCGFATSFEPGRAVDHWITEHWSELEQRWVRTDGEILGLGFVDDPADLAPDEFLTGGEAWQAVRSGHADPATFGVVGTENWGPGEIRGNAIRDLAALHRIEVLPWDEWGPMAASYAGTTDDTFDAEIDDLAAATATEDPALLAASWSRFAPPVDLFA